MNGVLEIGKYTRETLTKINQRFLLFALSRNNR